MVPCPGLVEHDVCKHIKSFMKFGTPEQQVALWRLFASDAEKYIAHENAEQPS